MTQAPVQNMWQFAVVHGFFVRFPFVLGSRTFDPNEFQVALNSTTTEDDLLYVIVRGLLKQLLVKTAVTHDTWHTTLHKYLISHQSTTPWLPADMVDWVSQGSSDFSAYPSSHKLLLVWFLCEMVLVNGRDIHQFIDTEMKKPLNKQSTSPRFVVEPFYADSKHYYYYFDDQSPWVYRQTDPFEDPVIWEVVTTSLEELNDLISKLALSKNRNQRLLHRELSAKIRPGAEAKLAKKQQLEKAKVRTALLHRDAEILETRTRGRKPNVSYNFDDTWMDDI
ncbi:hypothetical protein IWQ62_005386 [Dispira parvispora]|uniref:WHIM1 domain-containing protein n=1 Tax=Dispira parvispora TaxID=1520584 RepID=A0A9W8AK46_9FUNG|nr:hypothetical protein IWQ62_005386 [Dispira parvispora]